jgi:ABC-2 type transport system permease protein
MNILKHEIKANLKPFLIWCFGLFILSFAGMTKFSALDSSGVNLGPLLAHFPRAILALMGIVGIDLYSLGGYFAVISYYSAICASVYAMSLGFGAVSREAADKTYEFLFTKPRSRSYLLSKKIEAAFIFITLFSILNYLFSIGAMATLKLENDINTQVLLFCLSVYLVSLVFFSLAAFLSALAKETEKGSQYGNRVFIIAFVIGVICDMLEEPGVLRVLSPLKYFSPAELLDGKFSAAYAVLCVIIIAICLAFAVWLFKRKDLSAV